MSLHHFCIWNREPSGLICPRWGGTGWVVQGALGSHLLQGLCRTPGASPGWFQPCWVECLFFSILFFRGLHTLWKRCEAQWLCGTGLFRIYAGNTFCFVFYLYAGLLRELTRTTILFCSQCYAFWHGSQAQNPAELALQCLCFIVKNTWSSQDSMSVSIMKQSWFQRRALESRIWPCLFSLPFAFWVHSTM